MRNLDHLNTYRVPLMGSMGDETCGAFELKLEGSILTFRIIASCECGWEHVSVSTESRCPRWGEMCQIKDLFFEEDEWVIQYHPAKSDYVNVHEFCLHMWRPLNDTLPIPPKWMIG